MLLSAAREVSHIQGRDIAIAARRRLIEQVFRTLDPEDAASPEMLANSYEQSLAFEFTRNGKGGPNLTSSKRRKSSGAYYTPVEITAYLVSRAFERLGGANTILQNRLTILDPACGGGAFLISAARRLFDAAGVTNELDRMRIVRDHIHGVDIDSLAVDVTKRALLLACGSNEESLLAGLDANIRCGDALVDVDGHEASEHPLDVSQAFPDIFHRDHPGFDLVIGNPPWISYSGRHAEYLEPARKEYLHSHFAVRGWLTAHSLFIERSVRELSRRLTAFVAPDQVGHLAGYRELRACVGKHAPLVDVRYWGEKIFRDATTPVLTFIADRDAPRAVPSEAAGAGETVGQCWRDVACTPIVDDSALLAKIIAQGSSLGKLVADIGVHTGNCGGRLILPLSTKVADTAPILEGRQVSRYQCDRPCKMLHVKYQEVGNDYFTVRDIAAYEQARFVIRQTAAYPIVGPRRGAMYFRNSLLALYAPDDGRDVRFIVAILNSSLMRYVYQRLIHESRQRTFPQVKIRSLRMLPVKTINVSSVKERRHHDRIVTLVQRMLDLCAGDQPDQSDVARLNRTIDAAIYELYSVDASEAASIERFLSH